MKFIIIIYTSNKLTVVEMEDIRGVRLLKFKLRKIVLGVRMHFHHSCSACEAGVFSESPVGDRCDQIMNDVCQQTGSFVLSLTTALDTLSYHLIP